MFCIDVNTGCCNMPQSIMKFVKLNKQSKILNWYFTGGFL